VQTSPELLLLFRGLELSQVCLVSIHHKSQQDIRNKQPLCICVSDRVVLAENQCLETIKDIVFKFSGSLEAEGELAAYCCGASGDSIVVVVC
jgi:hypothetical protein